MNLRRTTCPLSNEPTLSANNRFFDHENLKSRYPIIFFQKNAFQIHYHKMLKTEVFETVFSLLHCLISRELCPLGKKFLAEVVSQKMSLSNITPSIWPKNSQRNKNADFEFLEKLSKIEVQKASFVIMSPDKLLERQERESFSTIPYTTPEIEFYDIFA